MVLRKAVIPAAGLGTRLLTATKEMPKEMLPIFCKGTDGSLRVEPALQLIFEELYDVGIRDFCFLVGRTKRSVEDHFTPDPSFLELLKNKKMLELLSDLEQFYDKVTGSNIVFVNQPVPKGFGDAVYKARAFTLNEPFLVHAGDDIILGTDNSHLRRLVNLFEQIDADVAFLVERVKEPQNYGVIAGVKVRPGVYQVTKIVEKPKEHLSNMAVVAVYAFTSRIYEAIERLEPDEGDELQLTEAIMTLISEGKAVYALELQPNERRLDLGTPTSFMNALRETFADASASIGR